MTHRARTTSYALAVALAVPLAVTLPELVPGSAAAPRPVEPELTRVPLAGVDAQARRSTPPPAVGAGREPVVLSPAIETGAAMVVGVTWARAEEVPVVSVRVLDEGAWGEWTTLESDPEHGPDPGTAEAAGARPGTEPLVVGDAEQVQVRVDGDVAPVDVQVELVDPGESPADATAAAPAPGSATAAAPQPGIASRAAWGADETMRTSAPVYGSTIHAGWVHHTVNSNAYTAEQVPALIRSIYAYHVRSRGWSDIGYNFLVDRFGRLWEGRAGGVDRPVVGAHTLNYNTNTFAVSAIGNFEVERPPAAVTASVASLMAWKLGLYNRPPTGTTTALDGTSRRIIGGHRDAGSTACPGRYLYEQLPAIRTRAGELYSTRAIGGAGATPVVGDVDGDGRADVGWFRDGQWSFRMATGATARFAFGSRGDVPVVADWNGDGRADPALRRGSVWYVRYDLAGGAAQATFGYGLSSDRAVTGRWTASGAAGDGPGVVRANSWLLRRTPTSGAADTVLGYGRASDRVVVGDWNGDGIDDPGVVRGNEWFLAGPGDPVLAAVTMAYGSAGDVPVAGDWDGDGVDTPGVVRGTTFFLRDRLSSGTATRTVVFAG